MNDINISIKVPHHQQSVLVFFFVPKSYRKIGKNKNEKGEHQKISIFYITYLFHRGGNLLRVLGIIRGFS